MILPGGDKLIYAVVGEYNTEGVFSEHSRFARYRNNNRHFFEGPNLFRHSTRMRKRCRKQL